MDKAEQAGVIFPQILIPEKKVNKQKWAVIACDQFTSNEDYWIKTARTIGGAPSSFHIIVPEVFVDAPDISERIDHAKQTMRSYIEDGVLVCLPEGMVLVERETPHGTRIGVILAVDLELYDTDQSKKPLIRATEETVSERMPVRMALREDAVLECPHVMLLINDERDSVIGPVYRAKDSFAKIYDTTLMQGGGHIKGWFTDDKQVLDSMTEALLRLKEKAKDGMLFAVGDGNHSLAAAKQIWENSKISMPKEEQHSSPLRYALVEIVNLYDHGLSVHPIHRIVFDVDVPSALRAIVSILNKSGQQAHMMYTRGTRGQAKPGAQVIRFESKMSKGYIEVTKPRHALMAQTLTKALDMLCREMPRAHVDYIHGDDEFHALSHEHASLGFLMEPIAKEQLFDAVISYGVLPRKSFSLGMAEEKRYYFESRLLVEAQDETEEEPEEQKGETQDELLVSDVTDESEQAQALFTEAEKADEADENAEIDEIAEPENDEHMTDENEKTRRGRKHKKAKKERKRSHS